MSFDLSPICRTCMDTDSKYYQIYDYVDESTTIMQMLDGIVPQINIKEEDLDFSTLICETCVETLVIGYKFQQLCIDTDSQFRSHFLSQVEEVHIKPLMENESMDIENESVDMKIEVYDLDEKVDNEEVDRYGDNVSEEVNDDYYDEELYDLNGKQEHEENDYNGEESSIDESDEKDNDEENENKHEDHEKENNDRAEKNTTPLKIIKLNLRKRFSCRDCGKVYDRVSRIEQHLSKKHMYSLKNIKKWLESAENTLQLEEEDTKNKSIIKVKHGENIGFLDTSVYQIEKPKHRDYGHFPCEVCGKVFGNFTRWKRHTPVHSIHKKYVCEICKRGFSTANNLRIHSKLHTRKDRDQALVEIFKCPDCPKLFRNQKALSAHRRKHASKSSADKTVCMTCQSEFSSLKTLSDHIKNKHPDATYPCLQCHRKFVLQEQLLRHMNAHKDLVCVICEKQFSSEPTLKEHMNIHSGENPYLCSECGKSFKYASSLRQHLERHSNVNKYQCPECPRGFKNQSDMKKHLDAHRGIKRYICDICGSRFEKMSQLKKHHKLKHL